LLRSQVGELLASILGPAAFALILGWRFGAQKGFLAVIIVLIVTHTAGYFLGSKVYTLGNNPPSFFSGWNKDDVWKIAKIGWGLCYGLGFGAGIGYAFHIFQGPPPIKPQET
jgi:hypothetical protein